MVQLQRVVITPEQIQQNPVVLDPKQAHYLCQVLRLNSGDRFIAMDGQGHWWLACLDVETKTAQILELLSIDNELSLPIHLIVAPPKGNHFEEVLRSATELGVASIIPLISERTILNPSLKKVDRWRRILLEASEQCHRQQIPALYDPITLVDVQNQNLAVNTWDTDQFICTTAQDTPNLWHYLTTTGISSQAKGLTLVTGPEGGWSQREEHQLISLGYQPISLGKRILRAVTAPIAALSLFSVYLEHQNPAINLRPVSLKNA